MRDRERVNSGLKTLSGAKHRETLHFFGKVAAVVAEGGSLFPRFRGSIRESGRQKVHRTVAGARFPLENVIELSWSGHFWKMRSTKCSRDCSESSVSLKKSFYIRHIKTVGLGALLEDEVGKRCTRLQRELDFT